MIDGVWVSLMICGLSAAAALAPHHSISVNFTIPFHFGCVAHSALSFKEKTSKRPNFYLFLQVPFIQSTIKLLLCNGNETKELVWLGGWAAPSYLRNENIWWFCEWEWNKNNQMYWMELACLLPQFINKMKAKWNGMIVFLCRRK